jgi:hypothetical protein
MKLGQKMIAKILEMLSDRIIAFSRNDEFDEVTWFRHLNKIYKYMKILEMNKQVEAKFTLSFEKLISYYNKINVDDKESTSTDTSNNFILETKREINTMFMGGDAKVGNKSVVATGRSGNKSGRHKKKSRSPKVQKGTKSGKAIPNQAIENNILKNGNTGDLINENATVEPVEEPKLIIEENKTIIEENKIKVFMKFQCLEHPESELFHDEHSKRRNRFDSSR